VNQSKNAKKPFFARLLEIQQPEEPTHNPAPGRPPHTLKYPTDDEEW
jgi:hypothetical protein